MSKISPDILTDANLPEMIVGDTIRSAHTNPNLIKDATVEDCLDALKTPGGIGWFNLCWLSTL